MVASVFEVEGRKVSFEIGSKLGSLTDLEGKVYEVYESSMYDYNFFKAIDKGSPRATIEWFFKNKKTFLSQDNRFQSMVYQVTGCLQYFLSFDRYYSANFDTARGQTVNDEIAYVETRDLSVRLQTRSRGAVQAVLLPQEEEQEVRSPLPVTVSSGRVYRVQAQDTATYPRDEKWGRVFNYSFTMDKTEYNWFRKVRREEDLFFGLELEVCSKVDSQELQRIVKEVEPKQEPFFIFKDDSSIGGKYDYRYEIVTVPCTPKYLRSEFKKLFEKLERLAKDKGGELGDYFDTSESLSNGIHIHIGKDSFEAESHIRRFLTVFNEKSPSIVEKFQAVAKRPERYDTSYYCKVGNAWEGRLLSYRLKKAYVKGRSQIESSRGACHCQKGVTIETRIFQGIFNLEHIFRCISLTEAVFHTTSGFKVGYRDFGPKFLPHLAKEIHSHKKYNSIKGDFPLCA